MTQLASIILVTIASIIAAYGLVLLKKGADKLRLKTLLQNKYLVLGAIIYGTSTALYIISLRGGELSILYPLASTTYIWIAIFSQKLLKEKMNKHKWLGIALILIGMSLIGIGA